MKMRNENTSSKRTAREAGRRKRRGAKERREKRHREEDKQGQMDRGSAACAVDKHKRD